MLYEYRYIVQCKWLVNDRCYGEFSVKGLCAIIILTNQGVKVKDCEDVVEVDTLMASRHVTAWDFIKKTIITIVIVNLQLRLKKKQSFCVIMWFESIV